MNLLYVFTFESDDLEDASRTMKRLSGVLEDEALAQGFAPGYRVTVSFDVNEHYRVHVFGEWLDEV